MVFSLRFLGLFTCMVAMLGLGMVSAEETPKVASGLPPALDDGGYFFSRTVDLPYGEAVARVREELAKAGFGVLTEIDVQATLKEKLNVDFPPYIILGACNPPFAYEALKTENWIGVLMPCNVVVRVDEEGKVMVGAMDPALMARATGNPGLEELGQALRAKMIMVIEAL